MEDPDTITTTDTARLLPRQTRRPRTSSVRMSDTEPTTLINRNRTTSTASYQNVDPPALPEEEEYQGNCLTDPRSFCHRLIALILMCLLGFGSYFCFDNPGALQKEIKDAMGISTYQFSQLYAWYSWPNVVLPIVGGYLMDSVFGIRLGTVIFASFIILGKFFRSIQVLISEMSKSASFASFELELLRLLNRWNDEANSYVYDFFVQRGREGGYMFYKLLLSHSKDF